MPEIHSPEHEWDAERDDLRARLAEAEETLQAIRNGEVDALLIGGAEGERVYTLRTADLPYRALVEQMQEGAVTVGIQGDIIYSNRCFAELVNSPLHQVIGRPILQFVEDTDRDGLRAILAAGAGKLRTRLKSGEQLFDVLLTASTVDVDGTDQRTLIATDLRALTQVQRENQSKDEFLAMLAHELRNPLGAISGAAQVLGLNGVTAPQAERARQIIERQVQGMARLVDDLLDVARVMTGKIVLVKQRVDLAEAVRSAVAVSVSGHGEGRRVEVTAAEPIWLNADPVRLEQVVSNLVSNALKFSPVERLVRVTVGQDGSQAVLRIDDEGVGISAEMRSRIFDLFVQAEVPSDRAKGGLGIGLTLVRRLVELHGGTVEVESRGPGLGSTFIVRLPLHSGATELPHAAITGRLAPKRILLVDDHADAREMYSLVLKGEGHGVREAADANRALVAIEEEPPDVAVIDIGLPGMDGHELARRIRGSAAGRRVRLIALTGYGFPDDRERSRQAGFDFHLVKPVTPDQLREALEGVVSRQAPRI